MPILKRAPIVSHEQREHASFIAWYDDHTTACRLYCRWQNWNNLNWIRVCITTEQMHLRSDPVNAAEYMRKIRLYRRRFMELKRGTFDNGRPAVRRDFERKWPDTRRP